MAHMFGIVRRSFYFEPCQAYVSHEIVHLLLAPHTRATVVIFREFHLKRFARAIERYRATVRT